jgi:hypothetical protein
MSHSISYMIYLIVFDSGTNSYKYMQEVCGWVSAQRQIKFQIISASA